MQALSAQGQQVVHAIAQRHGVSDEAALAMLRSVINGNGAMAQFDHPEFGGQGQWMRGGMTMVSNLFDNALKAKVDGLCQDLSDLVANEPGLLVRAASFQSQSQGGAGDLMAVASPGGSLFVPPAPGSRANWWPAPLDHPSSVGAQNRARYAYFPADRRLAIDVDGVVTVYDTLDHVIGGFGQQQSAGGTLSFTSQHGSIDVARLPVTWSSERAVQAVAAAPAASPMPKSTPSVAGDQDVFVLIERLAELKAKGILTDQEFSEKKKELLGRI